MNISKMSSYTKDQEQNSQKTINKNNIKIIRVAGSEAFNSQTTISNLVNSNPNQYFCSKGIGSFADIELSEEAEFNTVQIGFFRGHERKTKFTISYTKDFESFKPLEPHLFLSSGTTSSPEKHHFRKIKAKGIRVSFDGNEDNNVDVNKPIKAVSAASSNQSLVGPLPYNPNPVGDISNYPGLTQNKTITASIGPKTDYGANAQFFSVNGITLLNEELEEQEQEKLDHIIKEIEELEEKEESCKECKCIRCGGECERGVCTQCGITGNYNFGEPAHIASVFPASYIQNQIPGFVNTHSHNEGINVDTTPSKSQPPKEYNVKKVPKAGLPSNSGNTEVVQAVDTESVKNDSSYQKDSKVEKAKAAAEEQKQKDDNISKSTDKNNASSVNLDNNKSSSSDSLSQNKDNKDNTKDKKVSGSKDVAENDDVVTTTKTSTKLK